MRRTPLVRVVLLVLCLVLVTSCGSAADLASGHGSTAPRLTEDGGVVVSSADLEPAVAPDSDAVPVVVYVEPLCPHCKAFDDQHGAFLQERLQSGRITLEYRLVSFLDNGRTQRSSARAVNAALCVAAEGGPAAYAAFVHALLENQPSDGVLTDDALLGLADSVKAPAGDCVVGEDHAALVSSLSKQALGRITATPTVIVGGRQLEGVPSAGELLAALSVGTDVV